MLKFLNIFTKHRRMGRAMEFQARLLKGLELTSDLTRNWTDQVKGIVREASEICDIPFIFVLFPLDKDRYSLEIFWLHAPDAQLREKADAVIRQALVRDPQVLPQDKAAKVPAVHTSAYSAPFVGNAGSLDIVLTRSFLLETPPLTGMAGAGHGAAKAQDSVNDLILNSILTTVINVVKSVSAITAYTREIERFATRDPLTGLYNQVAFWDLLEYETQRSKRQNYTFSLLLIDIDNFKTLNDTFGHDVGDTFLREFAKILKASVRKGDIPARYGGDNFTAILPVCDEEQAYAVSKRVMESAREIVVTLPDGTEVQETVSIGLAVFPSHAKEARDLFLVADSMVHEAKTTGKDRMSFPSDSDNVEVLRSMGEKNIMIMEAVSQKRIHPYFQPIANVRDMRYEAHEVLTRIITNDRVIPAAEFIETAEGMGMIGRIDYQLYDRAFAIARDQRYQGMLFLNLSPKALIMSDFMPTIRKLMRDYSIEPAQIVFEITERDTVKNMGLVERFIVDLKQDGFRFAIDDFGAGYSSFQYIKTFSIDYLKVDGEFIRNMHQKGKMEKAIVSSISALAATLGIKTVAEYVESPEILDEVTAMDIDYAQGYFIQKPAPKLTL